jgi:3-oxoacyl-[acyl-carrier-protein] synthase-3
VSYTRIAGTGGYLPDEVIRNTDLEHMVDTTDQWIRERTGIQERRRAAPGQTTCDLAEAAACSAIDASELDADQIDLIVVATTTPDHIFPSTASKLQQRLGGIGYPAFDIQAVCSGFVYGLDIADRFIRTGGARRALVVGAETFTRIIDWTDRGTCILFGDGAGAVVLEAAQEPGILNSVLHSDGRYRKQLWVPASSARDADSPYRDRPYVEMRGHEVFKWAVNNLSKIVDEALHESGLTRADIDWLVPHQANTRILAATARKLGLPMDKVVVTVDRHGNTSAASVPLAFDEAVRDGRIKRGDVVLLEAFGGGFTWGATLLRY